MTKAKHGICIAALIAALAAPVAWADSGEGLAGLFEALLGQLEALWLGDANDTATDVMAPPANDAGGQANLGPNVAVGG